MATILLTGVTGTVGSSLAPLLKERGHRLVCLVRGDDPVARTEKVFGCLDGVDVLRGDIVSPGLGISPAVIKQWRGRIDKVIHCASAIKFDESLAKEITRINVFGTANVLVFAEHMQIPEFHYVSTAYIAGTADKFKETDLDIGQSCRNVYERTKMEAERLVRRWETEKYSIYRLGIIVGDTITGCTSAFNGFYVFVSRYCELRDYCLSKLAEAGRDIGEIGITQDGMLQLPIFANFSPFSTLNIVPVDWAARSLADLAEVPANGTTYHVVHPSPPRVMWLNDISLRHLGITGLRYGQSQNHDSKTVLSKLQKLFDRGVAMYTPYTTHEAQFDVSNMPRVLGSAYIPPPDIDEVFVVKLIDFAKSVDFGRTRRNQEHKAVT